MYGHATLCNRRSPWVSSFRSARPYLDLRMAKAGWLVKRVSRVASIAGVHAHLDQAAKGAVILDHGRRADWSQSLSPPALLST